jgi:hypothetical protein
MGNFIKHCHSVFQSSCAILHPSTVGELQLHHAIVSPLASATAACDTFHRRLLEDCEALCGIPGPLSHPLHEPAAQVVPLAVKLCEGF